MLDRFRLDGKLALVTGGSRGIGLGIARGLAQAGADILLVARSNEDLAIAKEELLPLGRRVATSAFNIAESAAVPAWYTSLVEAHGGVDILVNNAGMSRRGPAENLPLHDWQAVVDLNLTAVFALSQAFAHERIAAKK